MTPNTGLDDAGVISGAVSALFSRIGDGILVTHSQGCGPGWLTAMKSGHVRGIVAYEPGSGFVFPKASCRTGSECQFFRAVKGPGGGPEQFMALTRIPIVIYYGDFIPEKPVSAPHQDYWRASLRMARLWAETVNRHGGDVTVVHLPDAGMTGEYAFHVFRSEQCPGGRSAVAMAEGEGTGREVTVSGWEKSVFSPEIDKVPAIV